MIIIKYSIIFVFDRRGTVSNKFIPPVSRQQDEENKIDQRWVFFYLFYTQTRYHFHIFRYSWTLTLDLTIMKSLQFTTFFGKENEGQFIQFIQQQKTFQGIISSFKSVLYVFFKFLTIHVLTLNLMLVYCFDG